MTKEKKMRYQQAHIELYEIIKNLSYEEKEKIPNVFINNLKNNIDNNYTFKLDKTKEIFEQDLMIETKALLIQMYAKYLAPKNEEELWKKYNSICLSKIERRRKEQYNPDNIFKNKSNTNYITEPKEEISLVETKKQKWYIKFFNFLKSILKK